MDESQEIANNELEGQPSLLSQQLNPRIYARAEVVKKLVKMGIPDNTTAIGAAINSLADSAISLGIGYIPEATDAAVITKAFTDRMEELTQVQLGLIGLLTEMGAASDYLALLQTVQTSKPNEDVSRGH